MIFTVLPVIIVPNSVLGEPAAVTGTLDLAAVRVLADPLTEIVRCRALDNLGTLPALAETMLMARLLTFIVFPGDNMAAQQPAREAHLQSPHHRK
jgi:hypothetical protein